MAGNGKKAEPLHIILLVLFVIAYIISAIRPLDRLAWIGQMTPALLLVFLLVVTYRKFRFSTFVYVMAFLHALLLLYGAHYTLTPRIRCSINGKSSLVGSAITSTGWGTLPKASCRLFWPRSFCCGAATSRKANC